MTNQPPRHIPDPTWTHRHTTDGGETFDLREPGLTPEQVDIQFHEFQPYMEIEWGETLILGGTGLDVHTWTLVPSE